ncbi:MAG TPA: AAA family ATPase [Thermoanaerobaculia bacterium]|nr:AAA family ATPase [Thermoanaerobaculia bacterium]
MATVVVLNGTSSSGKTTIAKAFQEIAGSVYLNFSIDSILYALPAGALECIRSGDPIPGIAFQELVAAYYACVRELASRGNDLVIDNAITARYQAKHLVEALDGQDVLMVFVGCSESVLREREIARGDRRIGLAADQLAGIERWLQYDLRIDTSVTSPAEGAANIAAALTAAHDAFERTTSALRGNI